MGNLIIGYAFTDYTPSASTADTDYPASDLKDYGHAQRHFRTTVATDSWIKADLGSNKLIKGIHLNDVNFTDAYIQANTSDSWTTPPYNYHATIGMHEDSGRYKDFDMPGVTARYIRIFIPTQTPADGLTVFRMGTLAVLTSWLEFAENPSFPYEYLVDEKMESNDFESGGFEDVNLGNLIWKGWFGFDRSRRTNKADFSLLNRLMKDANLLFFENFGDRTQGFICRRRTPIQVSWDKPLTQKIKTLTFQELY